MDSAHPQWHMLLLCGLVVLVAGCAGSANPVDNPWNKEAVTIAVAGNSSDDLQTATKHAIEYWNTNGSEYATYPVSFAYTQSVEGADIVIRPVAYPLECGEYTREGIAGCAPLLSVESSPSKPTVVKVVESQPTPAARRTLKHELGHIVGLDHSAQPAALMSTADRPTNRQQRSLNTANTTQIATQIAAGINDRRAKHGLDTLPSESTLQRKATEYATAIAQADANETVNPESYMDLGCDIQLDGNAHLPDGSYDTFSTPLYSYIGFEPINFSTANYVGGPTTAINETVRAWNVSGNLDRAKHYNSHGIGVAINNRTMTVVRAIC